MASNLEYRRSFGGVPELTVITGGRGAPETMDPLMLRLLEEIREGHLCVALPGESECRLEFGAPGSGPAAEWRVHDPRLFRRLLRGGSLALGESYMDGWWDVEDDALTDLIGIFVLNHLEARVRRQPLLALRFFVHRLLNTPYFIALARRAVESHYDLGNDFFELMLDPTMTYSCGYQRREDDSLEKMQIQKYELVAGKLGLERGGRLLDIGCGWGGMLIHAAANYPGVTGVGITLSRAQYELGNRRIEELGLSDRVEVRLCDYREVRGRYDFICSIGMFEHVGRASYGEFMRRASSLLKPEGRGLLHTIGVMDAPSIKPDAWTNTYIFPGSRLPRLDEIAAEMRRAELAVGHVENLQPHYAETLRKWKEGFDRNSRLIRQLGPQYDERFMRMWNYYLQATEACFRYGCTQVYQVLFAKGRRWPYKHAAAPEADFARGTLTFITS